jgi:hypothetical protein
LKYFSACLLVEGNRSLDLLQGLLVYISWFVIPILGAFLPNLVTW